MVYKRVEVVGNIARINELRRVGKDNRAVVDFSVAVTPQVRDGDNWKDGNTLWNNCTAWGKMAENIVNTFKPGDRVILSGDETMSDGYTDKDGNERDGRPQITVDKIGVELTWDSAESHREAKGDGGSKGPAKKKSAPAKKKAEPVVEDDDLDFEDDDDEDFELAF